MNLPLIPIPVRQLSDIEEFHRKFQQRYAGPPRAICGELRDFRLKFLREEVNELEEALRMGDLEKALDALVDLDYVLKGTIHLMGMARIYPEAWRRVHRANMAKELANDASRSTRGYALDVVKPPGWEAPRHWDLIQSEQSQFNTEE